MTEARKPANASAPGVMGDWSQAQNLGQPGHPEDRVSEAEVKEAFRPGNTLAARSATPLADGEKPDQLARNLDQAENRQEALIDESLEESFPASDPPSAKRIT